MAANFFSPRTLAVFIVPLFLPFGGLLDIGLFFFFMVIQNWDGLLAFVSLYINPAVVIDFAKAGAALFTILQILRYFMGLKALSSPSDGFLAKPMIFPCRTSHTRLFPKIHSFSYSYLWVGIPVGWRGSVGGMLSSDASKQSYPWYMRLLSPNAGGAWNTVDGDDYLGRGHVDGGLQEKLQNYLQSQGIESKEYPYAYLLTAPRFLSYASNPVSIWNLYSAQKVLKAFILEVNNTFDERHIYFVKPNVIRSASPDPEVPPKLTNTWPKDFYVSTFNSRAGNYSISATDPLYPSMTGSGMVNTTVTLKTEHVSLAARIFSTGAAIDPATMSVWAKTKFLMAWWWVGLATFPRTLVQALKLLIMRKMQWVFRPEPRRDTMPRHADPTEIFIEGMFRNYLRTLVEGCEGALVINYSPAGLVHGEDETMTSPAVQLANGKAETIEFKVLTPSFYSRFLHHSGTDPAEAFLAEHDSGTITLSKPDFISKLKQDFSHQTLNPIENPRFWAIHNLRNKPLPIEDLASSAPPSPIAEKSKFPEPILETPTLRPQLSLFESFILATSSPQEKSEYGSRVLKMFISEYIAFGWMELLNLEIFLIRSGVAWVVAGLLKRQGIEG